MDQPLLSFFIPTDKKIQANTKHHINTHTHTKDKALSHSLTHTHHNNLSLSLRETLTHTFMVPPLLSLQTPKPPLFPLTPKFPRFKTPPLPLLSPPQSPNPRLTHFPISSSSLSQNPPPHFPNPPQRSRTLFPGGYKRPELNVPALILHLHPNDVLDNPQALDLVDNAVANWVRIVVLNGAENTGGKLYEAARLLKSVVRDRAYLLIAERVDIAAAVGASGVVLSDQGWFCICV